MFKRCSFEKCCNYVNSNFTYCTHHEKQDDSDRPECS